MRKVIFIFILLLAASCSTPYQSKGFGGGYNDVKIADNMYTVTFEGNAYTSADDAYQNGLRRCAELTKENGYKYFIISNSSTTIRTSTYVTPVQSATDSSYTGTVNTDYGYANGTVEENINIVKRPYVSISIKMYHNPVAKSYNANVILNEAKN